MQKDERGVVVPAPLQASDTVLTGPQYGDKYSGPAVADSYELSRCWLDLVTHSDSWATPDNLPALMVGLADAIPADQRADWLRRQANVEEVDRRISYSIRCGELPIWVAPIGEPERLVAPRALATIDKRSVQTGTFFPLSQEYKSEPDRPWLWERPLFVKRDDWVRYVEKTLAEKGSNGSSTAEQQASVNVELQDRAEDLSDAGWLKGLPAGWIDGFVCARRIFKLLKIEVADDDPAPWFEVSNAEYWADHWGRSAADYSYSQKMNTRLVSIFQRAICTGELVASWFDGVSFREVPKSAFQRDGIADRALRDGRIEVDPVWPDDWQHWNYHGWAIPKVAFDTWVASRRPFELEGLDSVRSSGAEIEIAAIDRRLPTDEGRVPLSEAVTWIAFGMALDSERLARAVQWGRLCDGDLESAQRKLERAAATLLKAGADGNIAFVGRHVESHDQRGSLTRPIEPLSLADYRQIEIYHRDRLHYGEGSKHHYRTPIDSILRGSERDDFYSEVAVDRFKLMKLFQPEADAPKGTPLAIAVGESAQPDDGFDPDAPADVAPWWTVLQTIGWVATRSRAYVALMGHLEDGRDDEIARFIAFSSMQVYVARNNCTCAAHKDDADQRRESCICTGNAGRALLEAIRTGEVAATQEMRKMEFHQLARVGLRPTGVDWLDISPPPIFSSAEVIEAFPPEPAESDRLDISLYTGDLTWVDREYDPNFTGKTETEINAMLRGRRPTSGEPIESQTPPTRTRKNPGPTPHPDWPLAIAEVTAKCIAAGYKRPLERGLKTAIQTMLLEWMAEKNDKYFSDDTAAKHADKVIADLPEN